MRKKVSTLTPKELREYQWRAIKFILAAKCCALFLDMGLGKTISVLSAICAMLTRRWLDRPVLIVGPIRVIETVWAQEAAKWSHTRDLTFSLVRGNEKQRLGALNVAADCYMINPENLRWLLELFNNPHAKADWPFSMLVIDESSAFKAPGTRRFKKLRNYIDLFQYRVIMTGTPTPNSLLELWPQMYIVDCGERLGTAFGRFKERFFMQKDYNGYRYGPRRGAEEKIQRLISDKVLRLDAKDWLTVPPTVFNTVTVDIPRGARAIYDEFEKEMFLHLRSGSVEALNAAGVSGRCHQIANGAIYTLDERGRQKWETVHDAKVHAVQEIVEEAGSNVIIAYHFKHDLQRLKSLYPYAPVMSEAKDADALVDEWNEGRHPVLLVHPKSAGHGLNMQFGGHVMVFFSLTWSLESHDQLVSRIGMARAQKRCIVHYIVARNTVDEVIRTAIELKAHGQERFHAMLRAYSRRVRSHENIDDLLGRKAA